MTACEKEISYVVEKNDVVFVQVIEVQEHSNEILFSVLFQVDEQAIDDFIDELATRDEAERLAAAGLN